MTTTPRKKLFFALTVGLSLAGLVAADLLFRAAAPWLTVEGDYDAELGLPKHRLESRWAQLERLGADVVFIGDSFVQTGESDEGWLTLLRQDTQDGYLGLGFSGASPSQYLMLLDRLRARGFTGLAVLVFYVGNDFTDEAVWQSVTANKAGYMKARRAFYGSETLFWPCFDPKPSSPGWLRARLEPYRLAYFLVRNRLSRAVLGPEASEAALVGMMREQCDKPEFVERVGNRLFFLNHHAAVLAPPQPGTRGGRSRTLSILESRRHDPNLVIAVILDREENCAALHGREVTSARPFVHELLALGFDVLDPNVEFARQCPERELYLPDGHWNRGGHALFAQAVEMHLAARPARGAPHAPGNTRE